MNNELLTTLRKYRFVRTVLVDEFVTVVNSYGYKFDKWTVFKWEKEKEISKIPVLKAYSRFYGVNTDALLGIGKYKYNILKFGCYINTTPYFSLSRRQIETDRIISNIAFVNFDYKDRLVVFNDAFYKSRSKDNPGFGFSKKLKKEPLQSVYMSENYEMKFLNLDEGKFVGYVIDLEDGWEEKYGHLFTYIGEKNPEQEEPDYFGWIVNHLRGGFRNFEILEYYDSYNWDGITFEKTDDIKRAFFESVGYEYLVYGIMSRMFDEFYMIPETDYVDDVCQWYLSGLLDKTTIVESRGEE